MGFNLKVRKVEQPDILHLPESKMGILPLGTLRMRLSLKIVSFNLIFCSSAKIKGMHQYLLVSMEN